MPDEYARFRNSTGCGHKTAEAGSLPKICGKTPTHRVEPACPFNINDLACDTHATAARKSLYAASPIV
jgi:hypothetical protein